MIVNFTPEQMSRLCLMCNEFNHIFGLDLTVNDFLFLVVTSFSNYVTKIRRKEVDE